MDPLTLGIGAAGVIGNIIGNSGAQRAANRAAADARRLTDRQVKLFDQILGFADQARERGDFDPEQRIAGLERDMARYEGRDMGNTAGALRTAGYRPGDSELGTRLDAVKLKYRADLDRMRLDERRKALFDMLGAYNASNPQGLNTAIGYQQGQQQMALGQMQNPGQLFASIMPFLKGQPQAAPQQLYDLSNKYQGAGWRPGLIGGS